MDEEEISVKSPLMQHSDNERARSSSSAPAASNEETTFTKTLDAQVSDAQGETTSINLASGNKHSGGASGKRQSQDNRNNQGFQNNGPVSGGSFDQKIIHGANIEGITNNTSGGNNSTTHFHAEMVNFIQHNNATSQLGGRIPTPKSSDSHERALLPEHPKYSWNKWIYFIMFSGLIFGVLLYKLEYIRNSTAFTSHNTEQDDDREILKSASNVRSNTENLQTNQDTETYNNQNNQGRMVVGTIHGGIVVQGDYYANSRDDTHQPPSTSSSSSYQPTAEDWQEKLETVKKTLKNMYTERFKKVRPFSLPFTFDIEQTWVSLALREYSRRSQVTMNHSKLLNIAFKKEKMLICEGNPAAGKTSLMRRLAYEWAQGEQELSDFDLIIYAEFREVREHAFESIADMVLQYNTKYKEFIDSAEFENFKLLINNRTFCEERRILFLLDGYDESTLHKQCTELSSYLSSSTIEKPLLFNVVITTRPGYLSKHRGNRGRFVFADVLGFTTLEQKEKYIANHFLSTVESGEEEMEAVHNLLKRNENLNKIAETPLFLTFICLVHERIIDGTLVELYSNIIWWLIDRNQQNNPDRDIPSDFGFQKSSTDKFKTIQDHYLHFPQLHCLGKMALHNLEKNIFKEADWQQFYLQPIIEQVGLLRKDEFYDESYHLTSTFSFPHRTIQEYLAALYYFCSAEQSDKKFYPKSELDTEQMNEFEKFLLRFALSTKIPMNETIRKLYFECFQNIELNITFDAFSTADGINYELVSWFISQCTNVHNIIMHGTPHIAKDANTSKMGDTFANDDLRYASRLGNSVSLSLWNLTHLHSLKFHIWIFEANSQLSIINCPSLKNLQFAKCEMKSTTIVDFATLLGIKSLSFFECIFEANFQLSFINCPSLKNLQFEKCEMESTTILDFATLPAITILLFVECTFEANSQLSFTNCLSLNSLQFANCEIESSAIVGIATLPSIDTVEFSFCKTDLTAWQSITDEIRNSSVKYLKLRLGQDFNKEFLTRLQNCSSVESMEITVFNYIFYQNDLLSFSDLIRLHSLTFEMCTFKAKSHLFFTNCPLLKNLHFRSSTIKNSINFDLATLPEISTVEFYKCGIDLATWQSITDAIKISSVKFLKLSFEEKYNKEFLIHLQKCNNVESMEIAISDYQIHPNDLLSFNDLMKLHSLTFEVCTFEANSQLSFTNCPLLKNLKFQSCIIESNTNFDIATLPAINAVEFDRCKINLATWQTITDAVRISSVKFLQLSFNRDFNKEFLIHLQKCKNVDKMEMTIWNYKIRQNDVLSFNDLVKLHSLIFVECAFEAKSQVSFTNCPSLKYLQFKKSEMKSSTNLDIAVLPAIEILSFVECTFEANSQLSFTNCPSLKNMQFHLCEIKSDANFGVATLPAIETVKLFRCKIDLEAWQSITDVIRSHPIKFLQLSSDFFLKLTYPEFLDHLKLCESIEQIHVVDYYDYDIDDSIFNRYEEEMTANLIQMAQELLRLKSVIILNECGSRADECRRLQERNRERIEKAGQERDPEFLIKYEEQSKS